MAISQYDGGNSSVKTLSSKVCLGLCQAKNYDSYLYIFTLINNNIIFFFIALFANGTDPSKLILLKALAPHLVNKKAKSRMNAWHACPHWCLRVKFLLSLCTKACWSMSLSA